MKYDVKKCIENIRALLKKQGKKIGDLEEKVGLSTGYLSKVYSSAKQESISIGTLEKIADELKISLDIIMYFDCESIDNNEKEVIDFLDNIKEKTLNKTLIWKHEKGIIDTMVVRPIIPNFFDNKVLKYYADYNGDRIELERKYCDDKFKIYCSIVKYYNTKSEETISLFSTEVSSEKVEDKVNDVFNLISDMAGMFNISDKARSEMFNFVEGK